jgi:hypothetical protein
VEAFGRDRAGTVRYYVYDGADLVQELDAGGAVTSSLIPRTPTSLV